MESPRLEQTSAELRASSETFGVTVEQGGRRWRGGRNFNLMNDFGRCGSVERDWSRPEAPAYTLWEHL